MNPWLASLGLSVHLAVVGFIAAAAANGFTLYLALPAIGLQLACFLFLAIGYAKWGER